MQNSSQSSPAHLAGKVKKIVEQNSKKGENIRGFHFRGFGIRGPGPVDKQGFSFDRIIIYKSPVPTILTVIPIVSQDKNMPLGNLNRAKIISLGKDFGQYSGIFI